MFDHFVGLALKGLISLRFEIDPFYFLKFFSLIKEKDKLKAKVSSFEAEMKKQFKPRKPICLGIIYTNIKEKVHPILCGYEKVHLFKTADEKNDEELEDSPTGRTSISKIPSNNIPEDVPEEGIFSISSGAEVF